MPLEKIEIGAKIGGGTFESVHKGMLFGTDVAIKIVTIPEGDVKREAMKEVVGHAMVLLLLVKYVCIIF